MSVAMPKFGYVCALGLMIWADSAACAEPAPELPSTTARPQHKESAQQHHDPPPLRPDPGALPEGMTLDGVLDRAAQPPPETWPAPILDNQIFSFLLFEQLEYRVTGEGRPNHLGWEAQGWIGTDFNRFWWKSEGEAGFEDVRSGEAENEFLYSRLITPFWYAQAGVRYANEWSPEPYQDTWSAVLGLEGLVPYMFEFAPSLYVSEHGDVSVELEAEYDLRITQRLVLQPRLELALYAQDVERREIGAGFSDAAFDLRLRYEFKRTFAPYIGLRYHSLLGETHHRAKTAGEDPEQLYFLVGLRFAF